MLGIFKKRNSKKKSIPLDRKREATVYGLKGLSKDTNRKSILKQRKSQETKRKIFPVLIAIFIISLGGFAIYQAAMIVLGIRDSVNDDDLNTQYENVIGFENIPSYPYSEFIFEEYIDDDKVNEFLNEGFSAYRILENKNFEEVATFYNDNMNEYGWEKVLSVQVGDLDKRYGEYWVKDGIGVRIFSKINDIWYQRVSENDARDGLAAEVKAEKERALVLAQSDYTNLLPDYPWKLSISGEYTVSYSASGIGDLQNASFMKVDESRTVSIEAVKIYEGGVLDQYLDVLSNSKGCEVINTTPLYLSAGTALEADITKDNNSGKVLMILNSYNNYIYAVYSEDKSNPFYDYVKQNIMPQVRSEN